jgi:SHS2 domain-containing protein
VAVAAGAGSHSFEPHTGEVELWLAAPSLPELFAEAARALAALMAEGGTRTADPPSATVAVGAQDRATLLVEWLNELILLAETRKAVFDRVEVERLSETEIVAEVRGLAEPQVRTAVKAATLHALSLDEDETGFRARVVLDV